MTKKETVNKIIEVVKQCEATADECNDCVMCHFCCGYYTGDWSVEKEKPPCPNCGDNKDVYPSFDKDFNYECDYCGAKF